MWGNARQRSVPTAGTAVALVVSLAFGAAGCSKSHKAATLTPNASAPAANGRAASGGAGATNGATAAAGGAGSASAAAGGNTLLATGPVCQWLTAAQVTAAAGKPLTDVTGDVSGGPQGVLTYHSCTWTPDGGAGSGINIEVGTWPSGPTALASQKATDEGQANGLNSQFPNSATTTTVSVGDGGYEVNYSSAHTDTVTFSKGAKVVIVEVDNGTSGAALTLANIIAPKV